MEVRVHLSSFARLEHFWTPSTMDISPYDVTDTMEVWPGGGRCPRHRPWEDGASLSLGSWVIQAPPPQGTCQREAGHRDPQETGTKPGQRGGLGSSPGPDSSGPCQPAGQWLSLPGPRFPRLYGKGAEVPRQSRCEEEAWLPSLFPCLACRRRRVPRECGDRAAVWEPPGSRA